MSSTRYRLPPLAALLPLEAAARHESFKRAAEELYLSQAAISRQIRALEDDLGVLLFKRRHRLVVLTTEGRKLARAVSRGLSEIGSTADELRSQRSPNDVVVRLELYVAMYWLVPLLPAFHAANPGIRVQVNATTEPLTKASDRFDLAIQSTDRPAGSWRLLFTAADDIFPICSPTFVAEGSLSLEALETQPLLDFQDMPGDRWLSWQDWFAQVGRQPDLTAPAQTFDSYPVMVQAALEGQGIGLGWRLGLAGLLARGELVAPVVESLHQPSGLSVFAGWATELSSAAATVADWLRQRLNDADADHDMKNSCSNSKSLAPRRFA